MHTLRLTAPAAAALLLAATASACKNKQQAANGAVDTTAAAAAAPAASMDTAGTPGNPSMSPSTASPSTSPSTSSTTSAWATPAVIGFAWAANDGEIQMGKLGEKRATSPAVKAFARQMVTDHTAMLADAKKLGTKLNAAPDTTGNDTQDIMNHGRDELKELTDKAAGPDWDKNYMDKMIADHQKVLDKLQDAAKTNTDSQVDAALVATTGKVQQHLTKAQDIKAKLP